MRHRFVSWLAAPLGTRWGYTFVGGGHFAERYDLDGDGWTDLPMYRRVVARPRFFWDDGRGKSLLLAVGAMAEERTGGTMPGARMPDGLPFEEGLDTKRLDAGAVLRLATSKGVVFSARGSATRQTHTHTFGSVIERDTHQTLFGEFTPPAPPDVTPGWRAERCTTTATTLATCPGSTTPTPFPGCSCRMTSQRRTG